MLSSNDSQYFKQDTIRLDQIINNLESNNINEKLTGMKKTMALVSKGVDVESLFPHVVKNVVVKHLEIKKLVYTYLTHYAERQPDQALLSVNNFQKDLNDKNQFIRALALRVMSSIRVDLITQIIIMAIKKCSVDLSPYVRKAACLAIPKAYTLDNDLKDELIESISKLLGDNNTMVLGAAVFAFNEVCPNNFEILHPHYRKLCKYLIDCDEWGQVIIINTLLRYARTQFLSPFKEDAYQKRAFYSDDEEDEEEDGFKDINPVTIDLDPDHRLLLKSTQPLLKARNSAVVLAVASLYYHVAPQVETSIAVTALLRLIRGPKENQYIVLSNIATMAKERPDLFYNNIKDFFVAATDPAYVKALKIEILALLANDTNVHQILKEFRSYVKFPDKKFVCLTIQAIGRVASKITDVTESCITGLLNLLSNRPEEVIAEAVVVIRHLIHSNPKENTRVIRKMACLLETIRVPVARASILWMIGEYYDLIPKIGPDALRIIAKTFVTEDDMVKMQAINLGVKLYLKEADGIDLLFQYILNLARFDDNYDIRDRTRLIRTLLFQQEKIPKLSEKVIELLLGEKAAPSFKSEFRHERSRFAIGSLSHMVNHAVQGYEPLADFPEEMPEDGINGRKMYDTVEQRPDTEAIDLKNQWDLDEDLDAFYNDDDDDGKEDAILGEDDGTGWLDSDSYESGDEEEEDEEEEGEEEEEEDEEEEETKPQIKEKKQIQKEEEEFTDSDDYEDSEEEQEEEEEEEEHSDATDSEEYQSEEEEEVKKEIPKTSKPKEAPKKQVNETKESDLLDMTEQFLTDSHDATDLSLQEYQQLPREVLLNGMQTGGLGVECQFSRMISTYGLTQNIIRLLIQNFSGQTIDNIHIGKMDLEEGRSIHVFDPVKALQPGEFVWVEISVDFDGKRTPLRLEMWTDEKQYPILITPPPGELLLPAHMTVDEFIKQRDALKGLNKVDKEMTKLIEKNEIAEKVLQLCNVAVIQEGDVYMFAGKTRKKQGGEVLLITVEPKEESGTVIVNCEDSILASVIASELGIILQAK